MMRSFEQAEYASYLVIDDTVDDVTEVLTVVCEASDRTALQRFLDGGAE